MSEIHYIICFLFYFLLLDLINNVIEIWNIREQSYEPILSFILSQHFIKSISRGLRGVVQYGFGTFLALCGAV